MTIEDRISYGEEVLNDYFGGPKNWVPRIDRFRLYMGSCTACILGQLFEDEAEGLGITGFDVGLDTLKIVANQYGFDILDSDYDKLQKAWEERLAQLQAQLDSEELESRGEAPWRKDIAGGNDDGDS